jgi:hypothetical protein
MATYIFDLATALSFYALMSVSYYGWGWLGAVLLKFRGSADSSPFILIWLGWAFSLFLVQVFHIFFPVDFIFSILLFGGGILIAIPTIYGALRRRSELCSISGFFLVLMLLLVTCWIVSRSMLPPQNYDSGLYHFNNIRWINSYHIIPGLGNLHGRLAFNQSFYAYVASLNLFPFFNYGRSIANSFLFLLLFSELIWNLQAVAKKPRILADAHPFLHLPYLFVLPVLCYLSISSNVLASPTPDLTSTILQLLMFIILAQSLVSPLTGEGRDRQAMFLAVIAATAITIKLSNLAFSLVVILFCFFLFVQPFHDKRRLLIRCVRFAAPLFLMLAIWVTRGYIMSGYPLYPSTVGHLPVDWAVPVETAQDMANWIYSWARQPGVHWSSVLGSWDWLGPWFHSISRKGTDIVYPAVCGLFALLLILSIAVFARIKKMQLPVVPESLIIIPILAGLIFWFFTAPDPRFALSLFWLFAFGSMLVLLVQIRSLFSRRKFMVILGVAFLSTNICFITYCVGHIPRLKDISVSGYQPIQSVSLIQVKTVSGMVILKPEKGDQCWDSPLPCTPDPNESLRLRKGNIESGFTVTPPCIFEKF